MTKKVIPKIEYGTKAIDKEDKVSKKLNRNTVETPHPKAHMVQDTFHVDYAFAQPHNPAKKHTVRSPLNKWEHNWKSQDMPMAGDYRSLAEYNFITAKPHSFGHTEGQRTGKLRVSGHEGAHQIGKRSKSK